MNSNISVQQLPNVYATGIVDSQLIVNLKYWKGGVPVELPNHSFKNSELRCDGITVLGNDVYVVGTDYNSTTNHTLAALWKNGNFMALSDGSADASAYSIFVSGNDIYVAGTENGFAKYWKNNIPVSLDSSKRSVAKSVYVSDSDIYIAGSEYNGTIWLAVYWKNGKPVILSDSTVNGYANSIVVSGSDVYVAGGQYIDQFYAAKYWINGNVVNLTDASRPAILTSIAVAGNDVYVAGYISTDSAQYSLVTTVAQYWENGISTKLTDGSTYATTSSLIVSGNDVYVAGQNMFQGAIWKNGHEYDFGDGSSISSIYLSNH